MTEYLNGTSALIQCHSRWFTHETEDKLKIQTTQKLNTTQKKQTTQNVAKQNYPGLIAFYDTRPGNEVGLYYNTPGPIHISHSSNDKATEIWKRRAKNKKELDLKIRLGYICWNEGSYKLDLRQLARYY